ncbi:MAG: hypothetical protein AB1726_16285 [Planctomycetota bacterium]
MSEGWFRGGEGPYATIELERELPPGITDLGPIALEAPATFAASRVVDERREPVARAVLALECWDPAAKRWSPQWDLRRTEVGSDGAFTIPRSFPGERFRLVATAPGRYGIPREFPPGAENLVLVLREGGAIEGAVLLDPEIPQELVDVRLTNGPRSLEHLSSDAQRAELAPDGSSRLPGLEPGSYDLRIEPLSTITETRGNPIRGRQRSGSGCRCAA